VIHPERKKHTRRQTIYRQVKLVHYTAECCCVVRNCMKSLRLDYREKGERKKVAGRAKKNPSI